MIVLTHILSIYKIYQKLWDIIANIFLKFPWLRLGFALNRLEFSQPALVFSIAFKQKKIKKYKKYKMRFALLLIPF